MGFCMQAFKLVKCEYIQFIDTIDHVSAPVRMTAYLCAVTRVFMHVSRGQRTISVVIPQELSTWVFETICHWLEPTR